MRILLFVLMLGCNAGGLPSGSEPAHDLSTAARDLSMAKGAIGAACDGPNACQRNCLRDPAWPNGYCTNVQLDCQVASDCPPESICGDVNPPGLDICLRRCRNDDDCRTSEGYACCLHGAGAEVCMPLRFCR